MSNPTSLAATPLGDDDFSWALEPLDFPLVVGGGGGEMPMVWDGDAALMDALVGAPTFEEGPRRAALSHCHIRGCAASLTPGYSQRAKLCEAHLHAQVVALPDTGAPGRFCQRCHKLQPLAAFSGTKRTCDAALASFNKKRRAQHSHQACPKADTTALAVVRPLRDGDEAVPLSLEATLRERLGYFVTCTSVMRQSLAGAAPALTPAEARKLHFCMPPMADACAQMAADGAFLTAQRASLTPEQAAETPAWSAPAVAAAQRAEQYVAMLASWAVRAAETAATEPGGAAAGADSLALVAPLRPCVEAMNALLAHTQAALALLRLDSRGRYLSGAALACELGAALMRRAEEVCRERGAWLNSNLQLEAPPPCAPTLVVAADSS